MFGDVADRAEARRRTEHPFLREQCLTTFDHAGYTLIAPEGDVLRNGDDVAQAIDGEAWIASEVAIDPREVR
ncbi:hypothetical protein [Haloarcula montana]|uniref:hypothetical protein n=1 Tax=Haloarcula montana TaxID=3111776 RepID=UPI002D799BC7|nr:hypothetical protein [Haloarcula sp. GH36]